MTSGRRAEHAVLRHLVECFRSALLVLYKLVMVNKVYELPLVVSEMCKGCQVQVLQPPYAHHACCDELQAML